MAGLKEAWQFTCTLEFWRMAVLWTFSLISSYFQLLIRSLFDGKSHSYPHCTASPTYKLATTGIATGRPICIITGATSGLGAAAAHALSKEGFHVALVGRSSALLSKVILDIKRQNQGAHLKSFQVDMSSCHSILKFKDSLQQWLLDSNRHLSVQLVINNAGILATSSRLTTEGYDEMMGTNYVGTFCLTKVLLPLLQSSPIPSRIVNVTSFTHRNVSQVQVDKETVTGQCFSKLKNYPCAQIYEYSKLCSLFFSYELHRQLGLMKEYRHVSVVAADPGVVDTNIMREVPPCLSRVAFFVLRLLGLLQSPEAGVASIVDASLAPPEASGLYFFGGNGRTIDSSALSYNSKLSKELWDTSCDLFNESLLNH